MQIWLHKLISSCLFSIVSYTNYNNQNKCNSYKKYKAIKYAVISLYLAQVLIKTHYVLYPKSHQISNLVKPKLRETETVELHKIWVFTAGVISVL